MKTKLIIIILLLTFGSLFGNWVEISGNYNRKIFEHTSYGKETTEIYFSLDGYELENVTENDENFQKISYFNEGEFVETGKPTLPRFSRLIAVPNEGEVSFEITYMEDEIIPEMNIYPRQSLQSESQVNSKEFVINEAYYNSEEVFPGKIVEIGEPAIMRDYRVVNVTVNPFQYDPQKRELRVVKNIEIVVNTSGSSGENIKTRERKKSRFFESLYSSTILNYDSVNNREDGFQQPCYLFICPADSTVETNLEYLTDWKHQKGFKVITANTSVTGTTNTSIKNYIQNAYNTWENPPEFICLVGDASGSFIIPTWFESWSGHNGEGDHPYTQLEGSDILPDAFIGRLSFNTYLEFQTIVSKILNYEKEPFMAQTDWYKKVLLVGDTSPSGQSCIITNKYIKELMLAVNDYTFTELYGPAPSVTEMTDAVNAGVSFFNYRGWLGMSGWSNSTTNSLNNGFMLPVVVTLTCCTGDFYNTSGRTEVFLKAGSPSVPKGGIAAIGTATSGTHTRYNNPVSSGIYFGIFVEQTYNMGGALVRGKLNLYNCFPDNPGNCVEIYSYWNNLMGDPGMEIWTDIPSEIVVTYPATIPFGTNYIEVTVENISGEPVSEAWVTALMGDDDIFATGYTDEDGFIILPINAQIAGSGNLTVTKHDFIPHLGSFDIGISDRFVNVFEINIDDDNSGTSSGNGDGIVNPGEDIELNVSLKNFGIMTANNVTAVISTEDDFIAITDETEDYGNIAAGSSTYSSDDFDFSVDANVLGGTEIQLEIVIQDALRNQWTDFIFIPVEGANLYASGYTVVNDPNGILDPGETAQLEVTIENIGSIGTNEIYGTLISSDNRININDSIGYFGNISAGGQAINSTNRFELTANTQIIPGSQFILELNLYNVDGYDDTVNFILEVGEVTVTDPLGPDSYGYYCYDDEDTDYYNVPVYNWIEVDPNYGGSGTLIPLTDNGEDQDDVEIISIPFLFRFYGEDYNEITVCSNGWIAMGQTEQATFRNWPMPGPMGPSPMIAPFWDDLYLGGGNAYYYYDSGGHYFVVEWSRMKNRYDNSLETFEVILYDPIYYPTSLNDGEIKVQYHTVNNVDQGAQYTGGHYATVGIENANATIGLGYTYNNDYPTAAKVLEDEMALLFTGPSIPFQEPYIVLGGITINDTNGNGLIDYGEDINLDITLNNLGEETATGVSAVLSTSDTYITITANSSNYDDISGGVSGLNLTDYEFTVVDTCPDGHIVSFQLDVISNEGNWNIIFGLEVNAPVIEFTSLYVDDGDNNMLDPGETVDILVTFTNNGGADAYSTSAFISTDDIYLTINLATFNFGTFQSDQSEIAVFNVTADASAPVGHCAFIDWEINADINYSAEGAFNLFIGLIIENFETGDFSSFPWEFAGSADWTVVTELPYEGTYCTKSGIIIHNQTSELIVNANVNVDGTISFYRKVSSENSVSYFYDGLIFFIDEVEQDKWDGEVAWSEVSFPVSAGNRTFKWQYYKDGAVSSGSDCAWVDYIIFPAAYFPEPADIIVSPSLYEKTLQPGNSSSDVLTIGNTGGTTLDYTAAISYSSRSMNHVSSTYSDINNIIKKPGTRNELVTKRSPLSHGSQNQEPKSIRDRDYATIGAGSSVSGTTSTNITPFGTYYQDGQNQYLFTASELSTAGLIAGDITIVGWNIASAAAQIMNGFNIELKHTTATSVTGFETGFTNCYSGTWTASAGWNDIPFSTPFNWDGTSNLLVKICFDNTSYTRNSTCYYDTYTAMNGWAYNDNTSGCSDPYEGTIDSRPQIRFAGSTFNWLTLNGGSSVIGSIDPGSPDDVLSVIFDTVPDSLAAGIYEANIEITSNDPDEPSIIVPVTLTVSQQLDPPVNVQIQINDSSIQLSWDAVSGATSYKVYSSNDPYTGFTEDTTGMFNVTSWTTTTAAQKKFYYVKAVN